MKVLHITGIPENYKMEEISGLMKDLSVDTIFIELNKEEDFEFKGTVFMKTTSREQSESLLNDQPLECDGLQLKIVERADFLRNKRRERQQTSDQKDGGDDGEKRERPRFQLERIDGAILHFTGASESTRYQEIKKAFSSEKIAWVDYRNGQDEGYVRFMEEGAAIRAIDVVKSENEGKVMVEDVEFEVRILKGDEEEEYWKKTEDLIESRRRRRYFRSNRRGGYGGRYNRRRRYGGRRGRDAERDERDEERDIKQESSD